MKAAIWNRKPEKSDREIHELPLPKQAVKVLEMIRGLSDGKGDLVFPSVYASELKMSEAAIGQAIRRMGFAMTGHGLRGVVSTGLNERGFSPRLVEVQLGHKKGDAIEAAYNDARHFERPAQDDAGVGGLSGRVEGWKNNKDWKRCCIKTISFCFATFRHETGNNGRKRV